MTKIRPRRLTCLNRRGPDHTYPEGTSRRKHTMQPRALFSNPREQLQLPFMSGFYDPVAQPLAWVVLRVMFGALLVYEGWPKIVAPLAQVGFVESLHFYPGWFWSPLLAAMQFFGGIAIAV